MFDDFFVKMKVHINATTLIWLQSEGSPSFKAKKQNFRKKAIFKRKKSFRLLTYF